MKLLQRIGPLNLLLVFVPLALLAEHGRYVPFWIFVTSALAVIPLAGLMGRSTEMLAHRLGPGIGGLLNASFGNAAELIIALFALRAGLTDVVKASLTGSILGNVLLVLGVGFLCGGIRHSRQRFNATAAGMSATMLALAAVGLLIPAIFHAHLVWQHHLSGQPIDFAVERDLSLEISIVLFTAYVLMLLFSLKTHRHLYNSEAGGHSAEAAGYSSPQGTPLGQWPPWLAVVVLLVATGLIALMSEVMIGAVEGARREMGWTELFVGVVVIAIVGNTAEHSTAVMAAWKNRTELAFQIAVGSGLQIALFVAPLLVFISLLPGFPQLDLIFSMLEVVAVVISVMIVGLVAYDGESNWMEGLLLLAVYLILAIAFYHMPLFPDITNLP